MDWSHISNARAIVETPILDIRVDPSQGSHFFHNITSLGIPYLTITGSNGDFVDWKWLKKMKPKNKTKHVRHVRLDKPLRIKVDGRCGYGIILKPE